MTGRLEVITGPMYSGKSSELIRRIKRAEIAGDKVKKFKPVIDDRYGDKKIGSHDGEEVEAYLVENSTQLKNHVSEGDDVVALDEANLFDSRLVSNLQSLAYHGYRVIAAGTEQTFRGTPFHPVDSLMAVADRVDKLQAVCQRCGEPASMNQRLDKDGNPAHVEDKTVKIGGDEIYEARCRKCHEVRTD